MLACRAMLAVSVAALMVLFAPGMIQGATAAAAEADSAQATAPVVPVGEELLDEELLEAEGEFWWVIAELGRRVIVGGIAGASAYFFTDADALTAAQIGVVAMIASCF
ncbi:MAG: hypothetical protein R6U88_03455 [Candidatus Bipolaricaulota bacterium]